MPPGTSDRRPLRPSLRRILLSDYAALLLWLTPVVFCSMYGLGLFLPAYLPEWPTAETMAPFATGVTVICVPLLLWRLRGTYAFYARAQVVPGVIVSIRRFRDRGRIEFCYALGDTTYQAGNVFSRNRVTRALYEGQQVTVAVDVENPRRAQLAVLHCEGTED